jgi:glutamate--cysteine ligase catalytic subunit
MFIPEFTTSPHPRFLGLAQSIRERRQEKVKILFPIYKDKFTSYEKTREEPIPGQIYMD